MTCWHLHIFTDGGGKEKDFFCHILTVAELWMYSSDPELKCQCAEWYSLTLTWNKVARKYPGTLKVMHVMFFCHVGLVMDHLVPPQTLVSGEYYANCCLIMLSGVSDPLKCHKFESLDTSNNAAWASLWHFNRSDYNTEGNEQPYQGGSAKNLYREHVTLLSFV